MGYVLRVPMAGALNNVKWGVERRGGIFMPAAELGTVNVLGDGCGGASRDRRLLTLVVGLDLYGLERRAGVQVIGEPGVAFPTDKIESAQS